MKALEEKMGRGINLPIRDESEDEDKVEENVRAKAFLNPEEERLFRAISKIGKRPRLKFPHFLGNLDPEELIDWIKELEEYFEYENIKDSDRVKFVKAKLKGHAKIWGQQV